MQKNYNYTDLTYRYYPWITYDNPYTITYDTKFTTTNCSNNLSDCKTSFFNCNLNKDETGRIEKGSESNQSFVNDNTSFEYLSFHNITYNLKPVSQKPVEISEIKRYCKCGYRIRKNSWKFCPKCSSKIE